MALRVAVALGAIGVVERARAGAGRRRHGAGHGEGSDRRRDAGGRGQDQQPGLRLHADDDDGRGGQVRVQQPAAELVSRRRSRRRDSRPFERDVDVRSGVPIDARPGAGARRRDQQRRGRRPRGGPARARSDGAHRHRSEPDREAAARVLVRAEPGDHARVARRRRPTRTGSSIRSAITRRRSSRSTTSRSPISRAASTRTRSRRTRCSRWRSSPAWRRPSTATRAASSSTSSPSPASISRSRPAALSFGYGSFKSPSGEAQRRRRIAHGRRLPVGQRHADRSLPRSAGVRRAARPRATAVSFFNRLDAHAGRHEHVPPERAGGAVVASTCRTPSIRTTPARRSIRTIDTFNVAPGLFAGDRREDAVHGQRVRPAGSPDLHARAPIRSPISRRPCRRIAKLTNIGVKADVSYTTGAHNVKVGGTISATRLDENFTHRLHRSRRSTIRRAPDFNPELAALRSDARRHAARLRAGGDDQAAGGLRPGRHQGRQRHLQARPPPRSLRRPEPRRRCCSRALGVSYAVPASNTVLRASYGRTLETPYNENLLLSSGVGLNGLFGDGQILQPGKRNQVEVGVQQGFGRWVVADFGYFNKHTDNGYDFGVLFDTPIVFPGVVGSLADRRLHRPRQPGRARRLQRVRRDGAHQRDLLAAGHRRHPARGAGRRLPDRPRSEVQLDDQPAVHLRQGARRVGGAQLALRLRPGRRLGRQHRRMRSRSPAISRRRSASSAAARSRRATRRSRAARPDGGATRVDHSGRRAPRTM